MVKPKTPRAKCLPRSKDAEALDKAHDALLDAAKAYALAAAAAGNEEVAAYNCGMLSAAAIAWARAQRKALEFK
jgi:hypothetical protein